MAQGIGLLDTEVTNLSYETSYPLPALFGTTLDATSTLYNLSNFNLSTTATNGYYTSSNTDSSGQQLISSDEANSQLSSISKMVEKGLDLANSIVQLKAMDKQLEATIKQYELDLENNKTTLEIRKLDVEIAQLNLAQENVTATYKLAESKASTENTKTIVYGVMGVAGMALLGGLYYISKK